jgi:hypothetical protein
MEELAEEPARVEEHATRLAIAREEVTRVLEDPVAAGRGHAAARLSCYGE